MWIYERSERSHINDIACTAMRPWQKQARISFSLVGVWHCPCGCKQCVCMFECSLGICYCVLSMICSSFVVVVVLIQNSFYFMRETLPWNSQDRWGELIQFPFECQTECVTLFRHRLHSSHISGHRNRSPSSSSVCNSSAHNRHCRRVKYANCTCTT